MRKFLILSVAAAALALITAQTASAQCACLQRTINNGTQCETVCCTSPSPDNPPAPGTSACGELCLLGDGTTGQEPVDELILIAGAVNQDSQGGCIGLLGGTLHSGQAGPLPPAMPAPDPNASYAQCKADAAAACEANNCSTSSVADGACGG
jgi:hypothetical protein